MTPTPSPEQVAGQRLMVGFDGQALTEDLKFLIRELQVGGIILFAPNIENAAQVGALCRSARECAAAAGLPPLLIAVDQEGGPVARLRPPDFTQFPGNPSIKDAAAARHFARTTAAELKSVGINMNMAPVMDVAPKQIRSIMADRVFGHDPQWVADMGTVVIREMQAAGVMAVAKHFPGIGRTDLDSHQDLPVMAADPADLEGFDLIPFAAAIAADVSGMMLSHIRYDGIDPVWPASLSPAIVRDLLRARMGYDGVVMTDDLDMGAIRKYYNVSDAVDQVLAADIDIALICHRSPDYEAIHARIVDWVRAGGAGGVSPMDSHRRLMALKNRL